MRQFRSDNCAGLCPEALAAIIEANDGSHYSGYGDDAYTAEAIAQFKRLFGDDIAVFFVATGTAANTLAIASLTEPWQRILCHGHSHLNDDESTAPERITHCRVSQIVNDSTKLSVEEVQRILTNQRDDVHQPQPGVLSLSNVTEFGTVYRPDELRDLCEIAHAHGFRVHVDGARFANAVASAGCDPRKVANEAGVDALSFGGTKNGLAAGESVIFFPQGDGSSYQRAVQTFPYHRKGTGHMLSKHRFITAPFARTLGDGSWLKHAGHANAMAARLAAGLEGLGFALRFAVEASGVFVSLPPSVHEALAGAGLGYYEFGDAAWKLSRLMCSFDTQPEDVDAFLNVVQSSAART